MDIISASKTLSSESLESERILKDLRNCSQQHFASGISVSVQQYGVSLAMPRAKPPVYVVITRLCLQWWDKNVLEL